MGKLGARKVDTTVFSEASFFCEITSETYFSYYVNRRCPLRAAKLWVLLGFFAIEGCDAGFYHSNANVSVKLPKGWKLKAEEPYRGGKAFDLVNGPLALDLRVYREEQGLDACLLSDDLWEGEIKDYYKDVEVRWEGDTGIAGKEAYVLEFWYEDSQGTEGLARGYTIYDSASGAAIYAEFYKEPSPDEEFSPEEEKLIAEALRGLKFKP